MGRCTQWMPCTASFPLSKWTHVQFIVVTPKEGRCFTLVPQIPRKESYNIFMKKSAVLVKGKFPGIIGIRWNAPSSPLSVLSCRNLIAKPYTHINGGYAFDRLACFIRSMELSRDSVWTHETSGVQLFFSTEILVRILCGSKLIPLVPKNNHWFKKKHWFLYIWTRLWYSSTDFMWKIRTV